MSTSRLITAALGGLEDKTQDSDRLFFNNEKASLFYKNCANEVANVGKLKFLASFKGEIPITSYTYDRKSSTYVTTTESHYADYAWDEVVFHIRNPFVRAVCWCAIGFLRFLCWISDVNNDNVCFFNNSLISTNLYRDEKDVAEGYKAAFSELERDHGKKVCIVRCLDRIGTPELLNAISTDANAVLVPSRVVNQLDTFDDSIWQRSNSKKDSITLERHIGATREEMRSVQMGEVTIKSLVEKCEVDRTKSSHTLRYLRGDESDDVYNRLEEVYTRLYLTKYSKHNPAYSAKFFREVTKIWVVVILEQRQSHVIEGFMCFSDPGGPFVSCPALGYDMDSSTPSYIILQFWAILEARSRRKRLNMSGGVSAYKQMRGAVPVLEYSGVLLAKDLSVRRRLFWRFLGVLTKYVIRPIVGRKNIR